MIKILFTQTEGGCWQRALVDVRNKHELFALLNASEKVEPGRWIPAFTRLVGTKIVFPTVEHTSILLHFQSIMVTDGDIWDTALSDLDRQFYRKGRFKELWKLVKDNHIILDIHNAVPFKIDKENVE